MTSVKQINTMLPHTGGRDLLMGIAQFYPMILLPVVERSGNKELAASLQKLSSMIGDYRSVTRLTTFFSMVSQGRFPRWGTSVESLTSFISGVCMMLFLPFENIAVLTGNGVINRAVAPERKAELGPRCVYFWFWSLFFELVNHATVLARLAADKSTEGQKKLRQRVKALVSSVCWFVCAWAAMPATGSVKLLANPEGSLLRPLHLLVEKTTVSKLNVSPLTKAVCGALASTLAVMDWQAPKSQ